MNAEKSTKPTTYSKSARTPKTHSHIDLGLEERCTSENCTKCASIAKKLKRETETIKNLHRQNGCLEGIITQKVFRLQLTIVEKAVPFMV